MNRATANLLLLITGATWGIGFVAQSTAMEAIGPILFTGVRFLAAALAVLPLAILEARRAGKPVVPGVPMLRRYVLLGLLLFLSLSTQQIGLLTTSVTNSGFLTGLYVVITPFLGVALWRVWPHPVVWPAALLTLGGIYLLSGGALTGLTAGDWWTILCAFLWACHVQYLGRVAGAARPLQLACTQFFICAIIGIGLAPLVEPVGFDLVAGAMGEILFAGVVSGGIAFTLQAIAQRHTTAPQAAIFMSSEALFAAFFGALLLGERMGLLGLAGCLLIFTAMLLVELLPMMRRRDPSKA
ncbi:DMT family transporter [Oricola cellulosilytica]|uniref:DMT family transporter n=1 Tax=Oricola cellulosilytica TaxID=1429082 RepID=A0A4R0PIF0_9HYPH|nr:DMT family transporter [Oricola cellulosilytica]TCD15294.1 DMT family transporter [Oricola cellulosilytica]